MEAGVEPATAPRRGRVAARVAALERAIAPHDGGGDVAAGCSSRAADPQWHSSGGADAAGGSPRAAEQDEKDAAEPEGEPQAPTEFYIGEQTAQDLPDGDEDYCDFYSLQATLYASFGPARALGVAPVRRAFVDLDEDDGVELAHERRVDKRSRAKT